MNKLRIALYDTQGYMKFLAEYFAKKAFLMESHLFTTAERLNEFLQENSPDVLLLGQDVDRSALQALDRAQNIILLSEGNMVGEGMDSYHLIFKYQSAENIFQEILKVIAETETELPASMKLFQGHTEFLGLYRPYGDPLPVQRAFFAKGGEQKKSLYIDMELLSGLELRAETGEDTFRGLSELIFYLKQRNEKLAARLRALTVPKNGLDYLGAAEDFRDLYTLTREDIDRLLAALANETAYERVVFHVDFLTESALYLLYCCDRVYIPRARNSWEENQKNTLERLLMKEGMEEVIDSIRYVSA